MNWLPFGVIRDCLLNSVFVDVTGLPAEDANQKVEEHRVSGQLKSIQDLKNNRKILYTVDIPK